MAQEKDVPSPNDAEPHPNSLELPLPSGVPVPASQIPRVCSLLLAESDPLRQKQYWSLLQTSAAASKALDLALDCVMNASAANRGEAVRYLRLHYPDRLPALLDIFSHDPDEEMRYQLSEFLRDTDQDAAVGMKIGMLGKASPEKQEVLVREIVELGNLWHLEGLHGLDAIHGGNSIFGRAADSLAKRIRAQSAAAG